MAPWPVEFGKSPGAGTPHDRKPIATAGRGGPAYLCAPRRLTLAEASDDWLAVRAFVTLRRLGYRLISVLTGTLVLTLAGAPGAGAFEAREASDLADRVAEAWAARQAPSGLFRAPADDRLSGGYGTVMIGYGLLRTGERRRDTELVAAGVRAVSTALTRRASQRGVFDLLAMATSYNFARAKLDAEPAFKRVRPAWEDHLRSAAAPAVGEWALGCVQREHCFHNHEIVEAAADLELLATGLRSERAGTKLADPAGLRARALYTVDEVVPSVTGRRARVLDASGSGRPAGLLSDSGPFPLAYHGLSSSMLALALSRLYPNVPEAARAALGRAVEALAGFMGPDGDVAYIGRRQQQAWALAGAAHAGESASVLFLGRGGASRRFESAADRALERLRSRHPVTGRGLAMVPREDAGDERGVDANAVVLNGLTLFMLNLAADGASHSPDLSRTDLAADRPGGAFLDPAQARFAAVRHDDVWFAVHARPRPPDLRNDFGLMALKTRGRDGAWRDALRPRPLTTSGNASAGPVLENEGERLLPYGDRIRVLAGGVVLVRGAYRPPGARQGGRPASFRFTPVEDGVRASFPVEAGDTVRLSSFEPEGESGNELEQGTSLEPARRIRRAGFASCCDRRLTARETILRPKRARTIAWELRAGPGLERAPSAPRAGEDTARFPRWPYPLGAIGLALAGWLVLRRRGASVTRARR